MNRSPATEGIAEDSSVTWVNLDDPEGMKSELKRALSDPEGKRSLILPGFELSTSLQRWEDLLNKALRAKR